MTKDDLIDKVKFITDEESTKEIQLYGFKQGDDTPYKINLDKCLVQELISVFSSGIKQLLIDKEFVIVNYSTADERKQRYYEYDLGEIPDALGAMSSVIGNAHYSNYDFNHKGFDLLDHIIVVFSDYNGHPFSIYKSVSHVEKITKTIKSVLGIMGNDILTSFNQQLLRIGPNFQVVYAGGKYILLDDKFAESTFALHDILNNQASKCMNKLKAKDLLLDYKKLETYKDNISFSRKLVKVLSRSKLINESISKTDILDFIKNDQKLREIIKIKDKQGEQYIAITNKSNAKAFLELLNDEFLFSQLTKQKYQAPDKEER